jgi:DNA modification methylase
MRTDVTLSWPGRRDGMGTAAEGGEARASCRTVERTGDACHRLVLGDALDVAQALLAEGMAGKVDLVYLDPPYASQANYVHEARLDGPADGRVSRKMAYRDTWNGASGGVPAYLDMLAPRLAAMAELLSASGTLWVHLDWRASYLARVLLDEIFGRDAFLNEIVWRRAPNLGRQAASAQFGRTLDTILVYGRPAATLMPPTRLEPIEPSAVRIDDAGRPFTTAPRGDYTDESIARLDAEGRVHRTPSGKVYIKYFLTKMPDGSHARERRIDALWTDIAPLRHAAASERTGFPTQKPRALLERIITCATKPGAVVVDLFGGSGTTAEAAFATGRVGIVGDRTPLAIATARARLLRAGAGFLVQTLDASFPKTPDASVRVRSKRAAEGGWEVTLLEPKEPAAWAIDAEDGGSVFTCSWHGERTLGKKSVTCPMSALVPRPPRAVRVYDDSGAMTTEVLGKGAPQLALFGEGDAR